MNDIKIIKGGNFGDSYYWDYRVWFTYNGEPYTYLGIGSYSGYIPCTDHIAKGHITMHNGRGIDMDGEEWEYPEDNRPDEKVLIHLVELLLESGEDSLDYYDISGLL